ncbi:FLYWCH-type zinc finger-containing protein 1 [Ornithorhynchus anatinus]|uniref:FLYWCH-type zinc finger 1 n=1 Tax=Ornithorhynchus anatinus TaxID=9258 RepID=K7ECL7_ORNAN|nr:FLYWCH-type zinc finger-containing protein 1 [Ornithorhynchus anatinus]
MPLEFLPTCYGGSFLVYDSFLYKKEKAIGNKVYWRCRDHADYPCSGRAVTVGQRATVTHGHCHAPDMLDLAARRKQQEITDTVLGEGPGNTRKRVGALLGGVDQFLSARMSSTGSLTRTIERLRSRHHTRSWTPSRALPEGPRRRAGGRRSARASEQRPPPPSQCLSTGTQPLLSASLEEVVGRALSPGRQPTLPSPSCCHPEAPARPFPSSTGEEAGGGPLGLVQPKEEEVEEAEEEETAVAGGNSPDFFSFRLSSDATSGLWLSAPGSTATEGEGEARVPATEEATAGSATDRDEMGLEAILHDPVDPQLLCFERKQQVEEFYHHLFHHMAQGEQAHREAPRSNDRLAGAIQELAASQRELARELATGQRELARGQKAVASALCQLAEGHLVLARALGRGMAGLAPKLLGAEPVPGAPDASLASGPTAGRRSLHGQCPRQPPGSSLGREPPTEREQPGHSQQGFLKPELSGSPLP